MAQEWTVEIGEPSARASAVVPPNRSMISETCMAPTIAENATSVNSAFAERAIDYFSANLQPRLVLDTEQLLERLNVKGVRNREIAKALKIDDSRVTEIKQGRRQVKLEEAVKLVRTFGLEPSHGAPPLPVPVYRLAVRYVAAELGLDPPEDRVADLAEDMRAFAEFVGDPKVRLSIEAAEGFFRAMHIRRPRSLAEAPSKSDLHHDG